MRDQLRHWARRLAPGFLSDENGQKTIFSVLLVADGVLDWAIQGIYARFPAVATATALNAIGRDRRITRGFDESDTSYRRRLIRWLESWRLAGHAYAILNAVAGYLSPHAVPLRIVTNSGVWYTRAADGTLSHYRASPNNWDWDGDSDSWSRFWLIMYPPVTLWDAEDTWGDGTWGDGGTWGSTATEDQVKTVQMLVQRWKPAHARCEWIIEALDDASFDPTDPPGAPLPDGTWGPWADGDPVAPTRLATARYWDGAER